ncbi:MAG: efflux RND transporter periplasmic adaptor subunit [Chitinophagaceae bacterium]|nr:efflux RND transporter periplasmic adaptor subunit [Chitinophagaceae bacterium]
MMKSLKYISSIFTLLLLFACGNNEDQHTATEYSISADEVMLTQDQYKSANIQTGKLTTRKIGDVITANGNLNVPPQQMVSVSVPIPGFVKSTSMLEGAYVKRGQVLAVLQNLDYVQIQQDYLEIKSQYEFAEKDYTRQQLLAEENVNAEKALQQSKANFQTLRAKYKGLESKLKLMNIDPAAIVDGNITSSINVYASISGYISNVNVNVGQYVSPNDVLFRIVNTEHLHVELTVFEKDISKLQEGQNVRFTLANGTKERNATVHLIGREISKDRTVLVHCHLENEDTKLLPGMFLKAHIQTNEAEAYALPESAIVRFEGNNYVFIEEKVVDETYYYKMKKVETGSSDRGYISISLTPTIDQESNIVLNGGYAILAKLKNNEEGSDHGH